MYSFLLSTENRKYQKGYTELCQRTACLFVSALKMFIYKFWSFLYLENWTKIALLGNLIYSGNLARPVFHGCCRNYPSMANHEKLTTQSVCLSQERAGNHSVLTAEEVRKSVFESRHSRPLHEARLRLRSCIFDSELRRAAACPTQRLPEDVEARTTTSSRVLPPIRIGLYAALSLVNHVLHFKERRGNSVSELDKAESSTLLRDRILDHRHTA